MPLPLKTASLVLAVLFAGPARAEQTILPGYWESTSQVNALGTGAPKIERRCLTAEKVADFFSGLSTSRYTCSYSSQKVHAGVADMAGQCVDRHGTTFNVTLHGTYTAEAFHLDARLALPNLPITGTATTDAHRLAADCPADAKGNEKAPPSPAGPGQP